MSFTDHWTGYLALAVFLAAYVLVIVEESLDLRKSKPVMVAAGVIWILTAIAYASQGRSHVVAELLRHNLLEYAELLLFLLSAMTFINTMLERNVFTALRTSLVSFGLSLRGVFWLTGMLAFCISPVADNLTTALVMGAVVLAMGAGNKRFISAASVNVVVAANAGGAFSPFGDITTLMVWQKGVVQFGDFFARLEHADVASASVGAIGRLLWFVFLDFIVPEKYADYDIVHKSKSGDSETARFLARKHRNAGLFRFFTP